MEEVSRLSPLRVICSCPIFGLGAYCGQRRLRGHVLVFVQPGANPRTYASALKKDAAWAVDHPTNPCETRWEGVDYTPRRKEQVER